MSEITSTWRCYDCKEDIEYIDDFTSPRCPKCGKSYDGGPLFHTIKYKAGQFLAHIESVINPELLEAKDDK